MLTITGKVSIQNSIQLAFPEFYIGLLVSLAMVIGYFFMDASMDNNQTAEQIENGV